MKERKTEKKRYEDDINILRAAIGELVNARLKTVKEPMLRNEFASHPGFAVSNEKTNADTFQRNSPAIRQTENECSVTRDIPFDWQFGFLEPIMFRVEIFRYFFFFVSLFCFIALHD